MKWRASILVCMLILSGLVIGAGSSQAAPFTGTITFMDGSNNVQDYFDTSDTIQFEVTCLDAGAPLQSALVNVVIVGNGIIGEVFNDTYTTDSYGQFTGYHWDDNWYTHDIGTYHMWVNYTGSEVVNGTFIVYDPVPWTADAWTSYYGDVRDTFVEDQTVMVHVQVFDQHGNPFDGTYGEVIYVITRNSVTQDTEYLNTDNNGEDDGYFYPGGANQFGVYLVTVYNDAYPPDAIGFFNFTIALPNRAVVYPQYYGANRTVFTEGETVGYEILLYYQNTIPYDSDNNAARVLLFHESDMTIALRNNTLNTASNAIDEDWSFYTIGYGEQHKGTYFIRVYNYTWNLIGTGIFMVIDMEIELIPNKSVYSQGDDVQVSVTTTLTSAYAVRITDHTHTALTGASWDVAAGTNQWLHSFTFPEIEDGWYNVDVYMGNLLLNSMTFELKKFSVDARLSQGAFVPGQAGTLFWMAVNNHDGGPISVTGETDMDYWDSSYSYETDPLDDISGTSGSFGFTVPRDAMIGSNGDIDIDAEDSADHNDHASVGFYVGTLDISVDKDRTTYRPGDSVYLTFRSFVAGFSSIVPNVEIRARAQFDGVTVGDIWTVTTDASGEANYVYQIPGTAANGVFMIVINATFDDNRNVRQNETSDFTVSDDPVLSIVMYPQVNVYSPGDAVSVPYRVLSDGVEITSAMVSFEARLGTSWSNADTIALGFGSGGIISFILPADREGTIIVQAVASTVDGLLAWDQISSITVTNAQLALFPTKSIYLPGENITWMYVLRGDTEVSATYRITDPDGILLAQGVPVDGSFSYQLPSNYARTPTATVYVTGAADTYIANSAANIFSGYMIQFRVLGPAYKPGAIMKLNYTITKVGNGPDVQGGFMAQITVAGQYTDSIWVTDLSGTLEFQLPEDIEDGKHLVTVALMGQPATFNDVQSVIIDTDAGALAHGTILGMNAGAFIALLLAIIGLIIAIIGVMKWRAMAKGAKPEVEAAPEPQPIVEETVPEQPMDGYQQPPENIEVPAENQPGDFPPPPPPENY